MNKPDGDDMFLFNQNKLRQIITDFYEITQATISVWDSDFNQIMVHPNSHKRLCRKIKENTCGNQNCFKSDKTACITASTMDKPYIIICHAGLLDAVVPVRYENNVLAYIMFGQIRDYEEKYVNLEKVKLQCEKYGFTEKEIEELLDEIPVLTHTQIMAAANFLYMSTVYLYMKQVIKIEKNELVSKIDAYITDNIAKPLRIEELCSEFLISKNTLYELSYKYFNTSISNYIAVKKLNLAKHYLSTTQLSVEQISEKVGFADYNYFIRKFKKQIGYTPLSYKKNFPHNIL